MLAIHHAVYLHASRLQHKHLGKTTKPVLGSNLPARKKSPNTAIRWSPDDALWGAATERNELANEYFSRQSNSLKHQVLCIMEGFMSDKDVLKELTELLSCGVNVDVLEEISNFLLESFPWRRGIEGLGEPLRLESHRKCWRKG